MPIKHSEIWNKSLGVNETLIRNAATEIMALELMTDVPGFVELRSATVLEGPPTNLLQKVFDEWTTNHPEDKVNCEYGENQLWLLAEMTDAGTDLETLLAKGFPEGPILDMYTRGAGLSLKQAWDIFFLTAEALAHGEQHAHFEHRDLHPGNVCIKFTDAGFMSPLKNISIKKSQRIRPYTNIEVTIIDYTLSRATLTEGNVLAHGMQDKSIFTQTSFNFNDKRQYDTYRWMRNVFEGTEQRHPKSDTSKLWKAYVPMTNVIWLHHLLTILLQKTVGFYYDGTRYKGKTEKKLASTLVNLRTDLEPANVLSCDYVTATDIVRSELDGKQRILCDAKKDERDYSHEAEYMRTLRAARSDRLESAASYS